MSETEAENETKRLELDSVDDSYDEWVICEELHRWEKSGMDCVVEKKRWYRESTEEDDSQEELMTESYIGVVQATDKVLEMDSDELNERIEVDQPNGVVKRDKYIGFDTLHIQLTDGVEMSVDEVRDEVDWICEQVVMM